MEARIVLATTAPGSRTGGRRRVFQPLFTTRRDEGGTGMGLEIVRTMLGAHGGSISLADSAAGAAFEIVIPRQT